MEPLLSLAPTLADWRSSSRARPLAAWNAWHRPKPRTSQRALLQAMAKSKTGRTVIALGGNRSGKTEWLRAALVALVMGSDHPDAIAFWERNGVDPGAFPKGPGRGYMVARTSDDSLRYHRNQIHRLLPSGRVTWWNRNGRGEARLHLDVPGYEYPAEIWFKSEVQGDEAMQGDSCRVICHDEEGDTAKVWDEASVRLWDQGGWHLMANTPVKGLTWVYDRFVEATPEDVSVHWIHSLDNPFLPQAEAKKLEENEALAAARLRGEFVTLKGRVWPGFKRSVHVVDDYEIPVAWPRFRAWDFGTRNPTAVLWGALTPDDQLVVYREHYQAGWTLSQHVNRVRIAEGWVWAETGEDEEDRLEPPEKPEDGAEDWEGAESIELTWADQEDPQQLMQLNTDHDMDAQPAMKSVRAGIDCVAERFRVNEISGKPALVILKSCINTIRELDTYVWADSTGGRTPDKVLKKNDHTCDCVRYLAMGVAMW